MAKSNFIRLEKDKMKKGSGDGTVPFASSTIYKDDIRTIAVKKEGLFTEFGDNLDFHGLFLRDSRVQNIINRTFDENIKTTLHTSKRANKFYGDEDKPWWQFLGDTVMMVE